MDLEDDKAIIMAEEEEDRISNLPEDIIHRILSFLDMKEAVQTCTLSHKWLLIWTSIPNLNLNSYSFRTLPIFAKFLKNLLARRNNQTEVSSVELTFTGAVTQFFVKSIINYAYSHNIRELTIDFSNKKFIEFPQSFFSSHTLKHLTISSHLQFYLYRPCSLTDSPWDFSALETLSLSNMKVTNGVKTSPDLFSKCVNLKSLTLHQFCLMDVHVFNIFAPKLSDLTITDPYMFPTVFNVVAPKLENLTASVSCANNPVSSSYLQLPEQKTHSTLKFSTAFDSLDKVNLNLSLPYGKKKTEHVPLGPILLDLFQKLRIAKSLTVNVEVIEALSKHMDQISHEPCPFNNLKYLKIEKEKDRVAKMPIQVRKYFLENSLSANVIMELPQPRKRFRHQVYMYAMAKKAKLEATQQERQILAKGKLFLELKLRKQDEIIANQMTMLRALQSELIRIKMAELKVQIESGNPDYDLIGSMGNDIKTVMDLVPESLKLVMEEEFSVKYEEVKSRVFTRIDASQWARIETELGDLRPSLPENMPSSSNVSMVAEP